MNEKSPKSESQTPLSQELRLDKLCDAFAVACRQGKAPQIEDYLAQLPHVPREVVLEELLITELEERQAGERAARADYVARFPDDAETIDAAFKRVADRSLQSIGTTFEMSDTDRRPSTGTLHRGETTDGGSPTGAQTGAQLGRFRIVRELGRGAFGVVYQAYDPELDRQVALKVARSARFESDESRRAFWEEARAAANLRHPALVGVYDIQQGSDGDPYIVQELIEGQSLADWARDRQPSEQQVVRLLIAVSEAVGYAHQQGLVHRDVKPANILVDRRGQPHVADFGLAVRETTLLRRRGERAGSPAYMSPEQVRGETHLLDGRADIWAIGVILYELLSGQRPFRGEKITQVFQEIETRDPKPLRQIKPSVPIELQRICDRCLAKRLIERYAATADLIEDLKSWLVDTDASTHNQKNHARDPARIRRVVPKGLRSFDANDADFFLDLLPGVRDREGLPESISFWKRRIETSETTFRIGLIYGPSGCGKSSMVKAGLLPQLSQEITCIYLEATPDETEVRLMKRLRNRLPALPVDLSLPDAIAWLRERGGPRYGKVLLVIDQLEQWLYAHGGENDTELAHALRHCDGVNVQAIGMIRSDFFESVNSFFRQLDEPLVEGHNYGLAPLFDLAHARKVLTAFGRAYEKLPASDLSAPQEEFVNEAVEQLAENQRVVGVRLALFGEMLRSREWVPEVLHHVGGAGGVGVAFLEETFSAATAPPPHRRHQSAARAVLSALSPEAGREIKGHMRSVDELKKVSGYGARARDFAELLRILDRELRLITPSDPEGGDPEEEAHESSAEGDSQAQYYQLTHDYLVPSIKEWLNRKQQETRRGRAELRLAERAALWRVKPEKRYLPSLWETIGIALLTRSRRWTEPQVRMMRAAARVYVLRGGAVIAVLLLLSMVAYERLTAIYSAGLVDRIVSADVDEAPAIARQIGQFGWWTESLVRQKFALAEPQSEAQLKLRMALLQFDAAQQEPLLEQLLSRRARYVGAINECLVPFHNRVHESLWRELHAVEADPGRRFNAGLALAGTAPHDRRWTDPDLVLLTRELTRADPDHWSRLRNHLRPMRKRLLKPLEEIFENASLSESERMGAASAFADYLADDEVRLAELLSKADAGQSRILSAALVACGGGRQQLLKIARSQPTKDLSESQRVAWGKRRARAAIAAMRQGDYGPVVAALQVREDPESLTQFAARGPRLGVTPANLLAALRHADARRGGQRGDARRAWDPVVHGLLLAMGDFSLADLPTLDQETFPKALIKRYADDPSSAVHGATGWLLRQWGFDKKARRIDQTPVAYDPTGEQDWFVRQIDVTRDADGDLLQVSRSLYFTFVVFPPATFVMGSPDGEKDRDLDERQHKVRLTRSLAVCDQELTWGQFAPFDGDSHRQAFSKQFGKKLRPIDPMFGSTWFESVTYCRWLTREAGMSEQDQCYAVDPLLGDRSDRTGWVSLPNSLAWPVQLEKPGFRLPTEAEWEYVCRAGTRTPYGFGSDPAQFARYGWCRENSGNWSRPGGGLRPNLRGLFDLHANLFERCYDWHGDYVQAPIEENPTGPAEGADRVARGGSWGNLGHTSRSASRFSLGPAYRMSALGFRLVMLPAAD